MNFIAQNFGSTGCDSSCLFSCKVIVESRTYVKGVTWYEILPYGTQNIAFISGKYIIPCYDEDVQRSPAGRLIPDFR